MRPLTVLVGMRGDGGRVELLGPLTPAVRGRLEQAVASHDATLDQHEVAVHQVTCDPWLRTDLVRAIAATTPVRIWTALADGAWERSDVFQQASCGPAVLLENQVADGEGLVSVDLLADPELIACVLSQLDHDPSTDSWLVVVSDLPTLSGSMRVLASPSDQAAVYRRCRLALTGVPTDEWRFHPTKGTER